MFKLFGTRTHFVMSCLLLVHKAIGLKRNQIIINITEAVHMLKVKVNDA